MIVDDPEYYGSYIGLSLHLCKSTGKGHAVIYDNGDGMDENSVINFATNSLNNEKRKIVAEKKNQTLTNQTEERHVDDNFLSKFGVGAKQAGFFLGDRIRLITKKRNSIDPVDQSVKEFVMDKNEMDRKFNLRGETGEAYTGYINCRGVGEFDKILPLEDELEFPNLLEEIRQHELGYSGHFTIIVIQLNEATILKLLDVDRLGDLRADLCEIYNFYIHPNLQFNSLRKNKKIKDLVTNSLANKRFVKPHILKLYTVH